MTTTDKWTFEAQYGDMSDYAQSSQRWENMADAMRAAAAFLTVGADNDIFVAIRVVKVTELPSAP